ncbi:hypothetical protein CAPTEDRAFT_215203 [Capitella teleta]|uniref:Uncharacterized protein n=1 Tax=Capitella teleta TaxID=283909 RepID=R7VKJ7_CAPTE|nr:hypothetical protein CAPTEDRAFT_215203 [Capitella teleta]|eukprot:ELU17431.1 hypothetical protein CAPTEDRAFT_215203 [Capitella teleta]
MTTFNQLLHQFDQFAIIACATRTPVVLKRFEWSLGGGIPPDEAKDERGRCPEAIVPSDQSSGQRRHFVGARQTGAVIYTEQQKERNAIPPKTPQMKCEIMKSATKNHESKKFGVSAHTRGQWNSVRSMYRASKPEW